MFCDLVNELLEVQDLAIEDTDLVLSSLLDLTANQFHLLVHSLLYHIKTKRVP